MGVVYAAYDTVLNRQVALKILAKGFSSDAAEQRLVREAQAMARLSHANVVAIYDVGHAEGRVFLSMELIAGATLGHWVAERPRSWREVVRVFLQAGAGLDAAHRVGLIHRDFKPANVLIDAEDRAHVADFGLAHAMTHSAVTWVVASGTAGHVPVAATSLAGTPAYMAPEQLEGKTATEQSDQFGFCVSLYEALCGVRPFAGDSLEELWAQMRAGRVRPFRRHAGPGWLRRAILRGLSVEPVRRFESMEALLVLLEKRAAAPTGRRVAIGVGAALCLGAVAGAAAVESWRPPRVISAAPAPPAPEPTNPAPQLTQVFTRTPVPKRTVRAAPAVAPVVAEGPGVLQIHVNPWGDIFVDGRPCSAGTTSDCSLSLPAGRHTVKIVNPFQVPPETERVVTVQAGQTLPVRIDQGSPH
jgi:hypothetical protein